MGIDNIRRDYTELRALTEARKNRRLTLACSSSLSARSQCVNARTYLSAKVGCFVVGIDTGRATSVIRPFVRFFNESTNLTHSASLVFDAIRQ